MDAVDLAETRQGRLDVGDTVAVLINTDDLEFAFAILLIQYIVDQNIGVRHVADDENQFETVVLVIALLQGLFNCVLDVLFRFRCKVRVKIDKRVEAICR